MPRKRPLASQTPAPHTALNTYHIDANDTSLIMFSQSGAFSPSSGGHDKNFLISLSIPGVDRKRIKDVVLTSSPKDQNTSILSWTILGSHKNFTKPGHYTTTIPVNLNDVQSKSVRMECGVLDITLNFSTSYQSLSLM